MLGFGGEKSQHIILDEKITKVVSVFQADKDVPRRSHSKKDQNPPANLHLTEEAQFPLGHKKKTNDQSGQQQAHRSLCQHSKTQGGVREKKIPHSMLLICIALIKE